MTGFETFLSAWRARPGSGPARQIFAIGDVHGQASALEAALAAIASVPTLGHPRRLVFLGDLIDRGPDSLGTVRLAMEACDHARVDEIILLPGNHELMLLDALCDPGTHMVDWLRNGGDALIRQIDPRCEAQTLGDLSKVARAALNPTFLDLMTSGPTHHKTGDLLFVHAGLAPKQDARTFLAQNRFQASGEHWAWIRDPFLDWEYGWGPDRSWCVVHGHTPAVTRLTALIDFQHAADHVATRQRLCLDAGAAYGHAQVAWAEFGEDRYRIGLTRASP